MYSMYCISQMFTENWSIYINNIKLEINEGGYFISNTLKNENQNFLIYKEIQSGAVAKSYIRKGFPIGGR
jgi:hypothetical protein